MRELVRRHRIACFALVTFATSWTAWLALAARGDAVTERASPLYMLGLVGPLVGAFVVTAATDGVTGTRDLIARMTHVRIGRWLLAAASPLMLASSSLFVIGIYAIVDHVAGELPAWSDFGRYPGFPATNPIVVAVLVIAINGFGEETGWRGFLVPALQRRFSPLATSLIVTPIWALWHAPAFAINAHLHAMPAAMLPMFVLGLAAGSIVLTWLYIEGGNSIALVAIWHGVYNMTSATVASRGMLAALETTVVMVAAAVIALHWVRDRTSASWPRRLRRSQP